MTSMRLPRENTTADLVLGPDENLRTNCVNESLSVWMHAEAPQYGHMISYQQIPYAIVGILTVRFNLSELPEKS